jgi:hypothetical protein
LIQVSLGHRERPKALENYINFDVRLRRMHCRATGTWDMPRAVAFRSRMIEVVDAMCADGGAFTVLTDLSDLAVHAQAIAPIVAEGADQLRRARLDRYAMIVPLALMRLQVRRLHTEVNLRFCDSRADACAWLDWNESPVAILQQPLPQVTNRAA